MAASSEVLAGPGDDLDRTGDAAELRQLAERFRAGVALAIDPGTGLARDYDVLSGEWISTHTISGFAPLVAGGDPAVLEQQRDLLQGPQWMGHPDLRFPLRPSASPASPTLRPRTYWRGPVWPFLNLLFRWARARDVQEVLYGRLRSASLAQLTDLKFAEYYDPLTGGPLGSFAQAWTAAAALERIGSSAHPDGNGDAPA